MLRSLLPLRIGRASHAADFVFNVAKGAIAEYQRRVNGNDPANSAFIVVLLKTAEADAGLKDRADLAAILGGGSVECDFTNYARKVLTDADLVDPTIDQANDRVDCDIPDQTWNSAGGAVNNTTAKLLVCYDPDTTGGTDSNIIPLTAHDWVMPTNGGSITAVVPAAGFFRAS